MENKRWIEGKTFNEIDIALAHDNLYMIYTLIVYSVL